MVSIPPRHLCCRSGDRGFACTKLTRGPRCVCARHDHRDRPYAVLAPCAGRGHAAPAAGRSAYRRITDRGAHTVPQCAHWRPAHPVARTAPVVGRPARAAGYVRPSCGGASDPAYAAAGIATRATGEGQPPAKKHSCLSKQMLLLTRVAFHARRWHARARRAGQVAWSTLAATADAAVVATELVAASTFLQPLSCSEFAAGSTAAAPAAAEPTPSQVAVEQDARDALEYLLAAVAADPVEVEAPGDSAPPKLDDGRTWSAQDAEAPSPSSPLPPPPEPAWPAWVTGDVRGAGSLAEGLAELDAAFHQRQAHLGHELRYWVRPRRWQGGVFVEPALLTPLGPSAGTRRRAHDARFPAPPTAAAMAGHGRGTGSRGHPARRPSGGRGCQRRSAPGSGWDGRSACRGGWRTGQTGRIGWDGARAGPGGVAGASRLVRPGDAANDDAEPGCRCVACRGAALRAT